MNRKFWKLPEEPSKKVLKGLQEGIEIEFAAPVNISGDGNVLSVRRLSSRPFGKSEAITAKSRWLKVREPRQKGEEDD